MADVADDGGRRAGLLGGVVGWVAPAVMRQIDTRDLVAAIDVNVIAADLDLDALLERLDVDAIAQRLDLDALLQRLDVDAIAQRLDLDALLQRLDVQSLASRLDMAQLTAGATQDVAVSGLDLVRRQLVRLDATVDGVTDRILRRTSGDRPTAPGPLAEIGAPDDPLTPAPAPSSDSADVALAVRGRRAVSGHYAGPATRVLSVVGDVAAALALDAALASLIVFFYGVVLGGDGPGDLARLLGLGLLGVVFVMWFWIPVALFGRTIAMAVLGVAVVRRSGGLVSSRRALVRAAVLPISLFVPLAFVGLVVGRERRALHDVIAGTTVVYDWGAREAEQPATIREQLSARARRREIQRGAVEPNTA